MNQFLETVRKLKVRRSTIWLGVAWVAIFVLYLAVRPDPVPQQQTVVPVAPVTRAPVPSETYEPTYEPTTTTTVPPTTTPSGGLNRNSPSSTTTTQVIPLIPNELIPPGLLPTQPTPTPTETPR